MYILNQMDQKYDVAYVCAVAYKIAQVQLNQMDQKNAVDNPHISLLLVITQCRYIVNEVVSFHRLPCQREYGVDKTLMSLLLHRTLWIIR